LNRLLIKDLHHKLLLLCHLPLSSIIDDNIRAQPLFQLRVEEKFDPLPYLSTPLLQEISTPVPPFLQFDHCSKALLTDDATSQILLH